MKRIIPLSLLCLTLAVTVAAQKSAYKAAMEIPYRNDVDRNDPWTDSLTRLDVYYPEGGKELPVVVWFNGGGMVKCPKTLPAELKEKGFIVVVAGYRYLPKVGPDQIFDDAAAGVAWAFNNIAKYGGSPKKIYVCGHSGGGYLTLMVTLNKDLLAKWGVDANDIYASFPLSGAASTQYNVLAYRGLPKRLTIDEYAAPYYIRGDACPIYLVTGGSRYDLPGRCEENAFLCRMLELAGHKDVHHFIMDGYGHSGMLPSGIGILINYINRKEGAAAAQSAGK